MPTQEEVLDTLKRLFVFVRCECGLVYKVMSRCVQNDAADIGCPTCDLPLCYATTTDLRLGVPTAMPRPVSTRKPTARPTILLDMDGVCVQFMRAAIFCQDRRSPQPVFDAWPKGKWDIAEVCGIDKPSFWGRIEAASPEFWINLQVYPYFEEMYTKLQAWGEVFFVTSPAWCAEAAQGKIIWLQNRFGKPFRNYVITNQKYLLARDDTILIDDFDRNCEAFNAAEGRAVLFPRPWNTGPVLNESEGYAWAMERVEAAVQTIMQEG